MKISYGLKSVYFPIDKESSMNKIEKERGKKGLGLFLVEAWEELQKLRNRIPKNENNNDNCEDEIVSKIKTSRSKINSFLRRESNN